MGRSALRYALTHRGQRAPWSVPECSFQRSNSDSRTLHGPRQVRHAHPCFLGQGSRKCCQFGLSLQAGRPGRGTLMVTAGAKFKRVPCLCVASCNPQCARRSAVLCTLLSIAFAALVTVRASHSALAAWPRQVSDGVLLAYILQLLRCLQL